jgi:hypothetical protein
VLVFAPAERAHGVAALTGHLGGEAAGFSFA